MQLKLRVETNGSFHGVHRNRFTEAAVPSPVEILFIQHLIFSSALGDEIVPIQSEYFAPEQNSLELVVLLQQHHGGLQGGSVLHAQRAPVTGHQVQRAARRAAVHRGPSVVLILVDPNDVRCV